MVNSYQLISRIVQNKERQNRSPPRVLKSSLVLQSRYLFPGEQDNLIKKEKKILSFLTY